MTDTTLVFCPVFREDDDHSACPRCEGRRFIETAMARGSGWKGGAPVGAGLERAATGAANKVINDDKQKKRPRGGKPKKSQPKAGSARVFKAKHPGRCRVCQGRIKKGDLVSGEKKDGGWWLAHASHFN